MPIDGIKGPATSHASTSNIATDEQIAQLTNLIEEICANNRLRMSSMNTRVDTAGGDEIDGVYEHAAPVTEADFGKTIEHVNEIITEKIKQRLDAGRAEPFFILAFDFDDTIKEQEWRKGQIIQSVIRQVSRNGLSISASSPAVVVMLPTITNCGRFLMRKVFQNHSAKT
ncbi:hypothetical protein [Pantoea cypripedii]|uniref:Uncharacterized protein n=1 Tax=Pantoea cypripedii TaxID=55209 RepID=A0A1X1ELU5_PANCY|nr:hypothetical protein [Pantoea cypripedii]MBP2200378.1 hypothetical protein [Pantoea cypripedii]ORM89910.1 hypothetical protein HA50_25310 [Pantoea cypripedii]